MIQSGVQKARSRRLATLFDRLADQDQTYLENLTAQLAEIHETSPEAQVLTGKKPKSKVQQNKEQKT
jgi:type II secretory pathway component PulM